MPLMHVFEVLLLIAIVAGGFFASWDRPAAKGEMQPKPDQQPAVR